MNFGKYLILIFSLFSLLSKAQKITNITTEQDGNNLNIYYDITGSKENQVYQIGIACETESRRFVLKSVKGDVGDSIKGGSGKKIVWDVFKDVDSLGTATFVVKIEKIIELGSENLLRKGFSAQLKLGNTMGSNTFTPAFELIAGYNILPKLFLGIGVGYQSHGIKSSFTQSSNSGIPNPNVLTQIDSFQSSKNEVIENNLNAFPLFVNVRYTFRDKKFSPYVFADIGTIIYGTVDYSYNRNSLQAYDSIGFYTDGTYIYHAYLSNTNETKELINSTTSITKSFFFNIGIGAKYQVSNKLFLTFDVSYSLINCTYNINNQYNFHNYTYMETPHIYAGSDPGWYPDVAFIHQSNELRDQITTEVKTFQSVNLKIGLIY